MQPGTTSASRATHWPALDGLRGLAVVAVVAYHLGYVSGGFLGVDLFFVLSGFLITSLLLRERAAAGRVDLRAFWARRARRLLPALGLAVLGTVVASRFALTPVQSSSLRGDALATLAYVGNWHFAAQPAAGYFTHATPSPLRHAWSLAIEEQYYLAWPILVAAVGSLFRRHARRSTAVAQVAFAGVVASAATMAWHAHSWTLDRLYLGTDTRAMAPLAGAALAGLLHHRLHGPRPATPEPAGESRAEAREPHAGSGFWAVAPLVGFAIAVFVVAPADGWLYRGGFLLAAIAASGAIAGALLGPAWFSGALGSAPLRWIGQRSYGLYLFTWPTQVLLAAHDITGLQLVATTLAIAVPVTMASYRFLEMPIRRGWWPGAAPKGRHARQDTAAPALGGRIVAVAGIVAVLVAAVVVTTAADGEPDVLATSTNAELRSVALAPVKAAPTTAWTVPGATTTVPSGPVRVLILGDSIAFTLGYYPPKDLPSVTIDSRGVVGCGLMIDGDRPPGMVGMPKTYDDCADPEARADFLGLAGQPDVILYVSGGWELADHERDGHTVGPGDQEWATYLRGLLAKKLEALTSGGAKVALWADRCGRDDTYTRKLEWYASEVLEPEAAVHPGAVVIDPTPLLCAEGRPRKDIPGVGNPRTDGEHFSEAGSEWFWHQWLAEALISVARSGPHP